MHRFFIPRPYAENMMIDGIDARHIYTVLKMKPGEKVQIVSDDGVTALAEITGTALGQTLVKCLEVIAESHEPVVKITLAQGLVKGEKMDFIIQKAVELGVSALCLWQWNIPLCAMTREGCQKCQRWQKLPKARPSRASATLFRKLRRLQLLIN